MSKVSVLVNDNYKILKIIYDNTVPLMGQKYCPLSQVEISNIANINRMTCCNIINKLKEEDLIDKDNSDIKHYILTDEAIKIIKTIEKL